MIKFIVKDDNWGIRQAVKQLWKSNHKDSGIEREGGELLFNALFNQYIPVPFKENREAVIRHKDQIIELIRNANVVWIRSGKSMKACDINQSLLSRLATEKQELPTYEEIEQEKMKWQHMPTYDKGRGLSQPILEEFVQLKFRGKRGGETNV
jgi:hypothetical protein